MHVVPGIKVLYFGTPVVLLSTRNPDGTTNLAPMSSAWWLGQTAVLGLGSTAQSTANLLREGECVLNLATAAQVDAVDRIALTTGAEVVSPFKQERGYRTERDKFGTAGLTEQPSELVAPGRVAECPIQLECRLADHHRIARNALNAVVFEVDVLRVHVEEGLVIPGTHYVDPDGWDPLIMKFCEYYAGGENLRASSLAAGWKMPHAGRAAEAAANA